MLTIIMPLPEGRPSPNDEDAWFAESLAELVDEELAPVGGSVGGFESGGGSVGLCVFDADPKAMAARLTPLLRRHCPAGTILHTFYDEESGEVGESVERPLFADGDTPPREPIPLAKPAFAYRPLAPRPLEMTVEFARDDRYVFRVIALSAGLPAARLNDALDATERFRLKDEDLAAGLHRLKQAGYVTSRGDRLKVVPAIDKQLPRTAKGNVSAYRDAAWKQVYATLFEPGEAT